ncbi:MAG: hypothetical protein UR66_C0002G0114 [Candidatus Moranbacteria bacterium GW2011_GWE1_35_17]|nr:MAG: hypothetical protein UR65_C0057G0003 [Candidatus Moranbacteria bacterium GW2011_GWE2_35_164]KKP69057.1 MAG: hypothetical protein UR66_C0002G0114 [Candidatus Moranbacteria bacterium GW2011_GWE1_35_17]KKP84506.1 MAG: hypothetical protein UR82_C0004G0022 [Candidatus Moranbacteria bacterium GW2011_GWF1_35_5]KKP84808.1 MAG: hypothetical protein UR83_C0011G0008 [Candidatus Moranbacteria bacterium GW2011_GWF2_35_54]
MVRFLFEKKGAVVNFEKSVDGIVVPTPVIFKSEILGEDRPVIYWYGDDEGGKQREFPLCVSPEFFDRQLAADPKNCDILFVGSFADLRRSRFNTGGYEVKCHRKNLQEETTLVCGMISGMSFIIETISVGVEGVLIKPLLYLKK